MATSTLSQLLSSWRSENQSGNNHQLMSILTIDDQLYDIKDPALEYLAGQIDSRLSEIEGATVTAQGVTFNNSSNGFTAQNVQTAIEEVLTTLKGTSEDLSSAETIAAAKKYAQELVNNLAGTDWSDNAKKVQEIIEELENSDNANAWATAIDKLAGLNINYTQAEADTYNAGLTGAISTETQLTAEQAATLNGLTGVSSTEYTAGSQPNADDAKLYNATLEGAVSTSTVKTPQTVKQYVDNKVSEAASSAQSAISNLDTVIYGGSQGVNNGDAAGYTADATSKVAIQLTEVDGVITAIDVKTNDIASATDLTTLATTVETNAQVAAQGITNLNSIKANKAAITTAQVNNWSASYLNENLTWTNTPTTVYVPVTGETL